MRDLIRVYRALLRVGWELMLEYRAQALLWILSFVFPLVMMNVWLAVVDEAGPLAGWGRSDFIAYYVAAALFNYLTAAWVLWDWDEDIRTGSLSVKLLKPIDPFHYLLTNELGWKVFILVVMGPLVALAAWLSPEIDYPLTAESLLAVAASAVTGFALNLMMSTSFAMMSFWSTQTKNFYQLVFGLGQFLSGWIAPLALFPDTIRHVATLTPFRYTLSFPLEILMGRLSGSEIALGFAVTAIWLISFTIVYRVFWRLGVKRYEAVGA